jgi:hypothetical protein
VVACRRGIRTETSDLTFQANSLLEADASKTVRVCHVSA